MVQFSYVHTKLLLIAGSLVTLTVMAALILGLQPNRSVMQGEALQTPPPMSSLLEECGPFYTFPDDTLQMTLNPTGEGGTLIPLTESPLKPAGKNLGVEAFKVWDVTDEDRPSVNDALATADAHDGYIVWYSPRAKADHMEALQVEVLASGLNVMTLPWEGGHLKGSKDYKPEQLILPQDRLFGFYSSTKTTQSCNFVAPFAFNNFTEFTTVDALAEFASAESGK